MAEGMFNFLNQLRSDPSQFITDYITIPWAETEIEENWEGNTYDELEWNEALARAGRQLLNEEGACGTFGDANSNYYIDILRKYYVYEYSDVMTLRVISPNLINWYDSADSSRYALEWILSQENIDKSILRSNGHTQVGISCACAQESLDCPDTPVHQCLIVFAKTAKQREIRELIPGYQEIDYNTKCSERCIYSYIDWDLSDDFFISYGQTIYETTDCLLDEVIDRNGQCQQCEELNLGCSVCSDAFENTYDEFFPDQLNKCVECEANIQVLFED